jgi:hypothetical protein
MEVIKKLDNGINSILSTLIKEPTLIRGAIHLLLMLYAARIAPKLPDAVLALFENQYFKLFVFSLILWTAQFSPSTSILIAIAFMVSINYVNQKPLWEFMDGDIQLLEEETAGPETTMPPQTTAAIEAVVALANAAVSPTAVSSEQVIPVAEVAAAAVTTPIGLQAIQVLAEQAVMPTPAPTQEVQRAVDLAVESITTTTSPGTAMPPQTTAAIEAVVALANAAVSPTAVSSEQVIPVAEVAAAAVTTPIGLQAIQVLAEQAVTPTPAPTPEVQRAVDIAVESITAAPASTSEPTTTASPQVQEAGCYPLRRYDMSKVLPHGADSYQEFTA